MGHEAGCGNGGSKLVSILPLQSKLVHTSVEYQRQTHTQNLIINNNAPVYALPRNMRVGP